MEVGFLTVTFPLRMEVDGHFSRKEGPFRSLVIPAALYKHTRCPGGQDILGELSGLMTETCIARSLTLTSMPV